MIANEEQLLKEAKEKKDKARQDARVITDYKITKLKGRLLIVKQLTLARGVVQTETDSGLSLVIGKNLEYASEDGKFNEHEEKIGEVILVGDGIKEEDFKIKDRIMYFDFNAWDIEISGEKHRVIKYDDIIAKIETFKAETFYGGDLFDSKKLTGHFTTMIPEKASQDVMANQ